jgi:hypothetical protein
VKFSEIAVSCILSLFMAPSGELLAQEAWKADVHLATADENEAEDEEFEGNSRQRLEELRGWLEKRHQERGEDSPASISRPMPIPEWTYSPERTERSVSRHGKRHHAGHRHKHSSHGYRRGYSHSSRHTAHKRHSGHFKAAHSKTARRSHGAKSRQHPVHRQARTVKLKPTPAHSVAKRSGKTRAHGKNAKR